MSTRPLRQAVSVDLLRRLFYDRSVREAAFVFAVTRSIVLIIFVLVGNVSLDRNAPDYNPTDQHPTVSLRHVTIGRTLRKTLERGDAGWYMGIAREGYERIPFSQTEQHNWGFFPLYPLLMRAVGAATGEYLLGGALLSNIFFFFALILLHKLVLRWGFDEQIADRAIFYLATFPTSYFFSLAMTESLFLFLVVASFYQGVRGRWWAAGAFGALASAARVNGVLLLPALLLLYWQRNDKSFKLRRDVLWLLLVPLGLLLFMFYLWTITGNPLAFKDILVTWNRRNGFFLFTLLNYLSNPLDLIEPWNFRLMNFASAILCFVVAYYWARRREWTLSFYTLAAVVLPLSSMSLVALSRYTAVVFPVFIALALVGRRKRVDQTIRVVFVVLFALMTIFFAAMFSFAAA